MKLLKLLMILICVSVFGLLSGCSIPSFSKPVYVAPGYIAELAKPVKVSVWVVNEKTKKRELRQVKASAGWYIGRVPDAK